MSDVEKRQAMLRALVRACDWFWLLLLASVPVQLALMIWVDVRWLATGLLTIAVMFVLHRVGVEAKTKHDAIGSQP